MIKRSISLQMYDRFLSGIAMLAMDLRSKSLDFGSISNPKPSEGAITTVRWSIHPTQTQAQFSNGSRARIPRSECLRLGQTLCLLAKHKSRYSKPGLPPEHLGLMVSTSPFWQTLSCTGVSSLFEHAMGHRPSTLG